MSTMQQQFSFTRGTSGNRSGPLLLTLLMFFAGWHGVGQPSTAATATNEALPAQNATVPRRNRIQEVIEFMQSPPNVELAIWRTTDYPPNKTPVRRYFLARWQKDRCLFREAPSLEALQTTNIFPRTVTQGRYGTNFWYFGPDTNVFTFGTVDSCAKYEDRKSAAFGFRAWEDELSYLMNYGIANLRIGQVHWQGYSFSAESIHGLSVSGQITQRDENHLLISMEVQRNGERYPNDSIITFDPDAGDSLPKMIRRVRKEKAGDVTSSELEVIKLITTAKEIDETNFHAAPYVTPNMMVVFLNQAAGFLVKNDGTLGRKIEHGEPSNLPKDRPVAFYLFLLLVIGSGVLGCVLLRRHRRANI